MNRHRIVNTTWFEDYSVDFAHQDLHLYLYSERLLLTCR
jgi:hypothetical protein